MIEFMKEMFAWIMANYKGILITLAAAWPVLEVIVRFTPTKTDDSALERIGKFGRKLMDTLGIPNKKKEVKTEEDKPTEVATKEEKTDEGNS